MVIRLKESMSVRVYEFSKKHGLSSKELVKLLQDNRFDVASHMTVLSEQAIAFLENHFQKKNLEPSQKVAPVKSPVITPKPLETSPQKAPEPVVMPVKEQRVAFVKGASKNTAKKSGKSHVSRFASSRPEAGSTFASAPKAQVPPQELKPITIAPMTVAEFAEKSKKTLPDIILYLMKKGIIAARNQLISAEVVGDLIRHYELKVAEAPSAVQAQTSDRFESVAGEVQKERLPVVVVIGHVDHGKTTLLDFVRKTRVAAREKGGITQHLGAYEAHTPHGDIVFLDTPGHEAFSLMRVRGIKVADIAILVVAADDGVMPQTIEAIRAAQSINLPIIVALNKIDKVNAAQIDKVKHSLSQYGLTAEEWGGQTVVVPISAKLGQGVDNLLEVVVLQSQLMELAANPGVPARGFVLESKLEKGLGSVATVICQQGTLRIGDYFIAGSTQGRVSVLVDSSGKRVKEVGPSIPVQISGFDQLPQVGAQFKAITVEEYKKFKQTHIASSAKSRGTATGENILNLIIKVDNVSSLEAVLGAIAKFSTKAFKEFNVIHAAVGPISESDIILAVDTDALVYGLHVKTQPGTTVIAQKHDVAIKLFDIIYKMLEDLEVVAEQGRPVKMVTKKTGEAVVLKIFDIKNLGVIAGAQVKSGVCGRNGKVVIWRGKYKIGEGPIKSLQREKKAVKEVHAGFECGFLIDGFSDWQVDDRIECYLEVAEGQ